MKVWCLVGVLPVWCACAEIGSPEKTSVGSSTRPLGESQGGFPSWEERVHHLLINRARCDPQADLAACDSCLDKGCYAPVPPLVWDYALNRSARFHGANLTLSGVNMSHDSPCTLVSDIGDQYLPGPCHGAPACACVGGAVGCNPTCPSCTERIRMFSDPVALYGENMASSAGPGFTPWQSFYGLLHEPYASTQCPSSSQQIPDPEGHSNGHRFNILDGALTRVGVGCAGDFCTQDFRQDLFGTAPPIPKIPSAIHYPESGSTLTFYAIWYDSQAPSSAIVNLDGACRTLTRERGVSAGHAVYSVQYPDVPAGCHHYDFEFEDSTTAPIRFPDFGSLATGCGYEWTAAEPGECVCIGCTPDGGTAFDSSAGTDAGADADAGEAPMPDGSAATDNGASGGDSGILSPDSAVVRDAAVGRDGGGTVLPDGSTVTDAGASGGDSGAMLPDSSAATDVAAAGIDSSPPGNETEVLASGCRCDAVAAQDPGASGAASLAWLVVLASALVVRRARCDCP